VRGVNNELLFNAVFARMYRLLTPRHFYARCFILLLYFNLRRPDPKLVYVVFAFV